MTRIAIIGSGAWGTALAQQMATQNQNQVGLFCRDDAQRSILKTQHQNPRYLPGIELSKSLEFPDTVEQTIANTDAVIIATPCRVFESILELLAKAQYDGDIVWACKGLAPGTADLLSSRIDAHFPASTGRAMISGPSFAVELAQGLPTAVSVASSDIATAQRISNWLHGQNLRAYVQLDLIGVQIGAALKNVYAIAAGISDGLQFGANARAALITRGLAEMIRLGVEIGASPNTFLGLSGLGDLSLTCTDDLSRNRRYGLALAKGLSDGAAIESIGQAVEGRETARTAKVLADRYEIECPIIEEVYNVIYRQLSPQQAVANLLSRASRAE